MAKETKEGKEQKEKFEDHLKVLERTIDELEKGELPLEDALAKYEAGMKAWKKCYDLLNAAEKKIELLLKEEGADEKGKLKRKEFHKDDKE